jgi:hypothetical protein
MDVVAMSAGRLLDGADEADTGPVVFLDLVTAVLGVLAHQGGGHVADALLGFLVELLECSQPRIRRTARLGR